MHITCLSRSISFPPYGRLSLRSAAKHFLLSHTHLRCVLFARSQPTQTHTHARMQTQIERILSTLSPLCIALLCVAFLRLHSPHLHSSCLFCSPNVALALGTRSLALSLLCARSASPACSNNTRTQDSVCVFIECSPRGII